jgi:hypothetical protein
MTPSTTLTLSINDPQLLQKIIAAFPQPKLPTLADVPTVTSLKAGGGLSPEMAQFVDNVGVGSADFNNNFNQSVKYDQGRANDNEAQKFSNALYAWFSSRGTNHELPFPDRPHFFVIDTAQYVAYWTGYCDAVINNFLSGGTPDNPSAMGVDTGKIAQNKFFLVPAPLPPLPVITDAQIVTGPPVTSPVGAYRGYNLWEATPIAVNFPPGYPYPCPDANSSTGWLQYLPTPFHNYWTVGPAPALAATTQSLLDALRNGLKPPVVA